MSQEPEAPQGRWVLIAWIGVPVILLGGVLVAILMQSPGKVKPPTKGGEAKGANELALARAALAKQTDLATCKAIVPRLNAHLRVAKEHAVPETSAADRAKLSADLGLDKGEADEVFSSIYTPLDAFHIESCFLLRSVAASLEITAPTAKGTPRPRLTPLELAEAGFAWTCRNVRLDGFETVPAPVPYTLRRGWGTPFERSLVFLSLLEQFGQEDDDGSGLQGCLLGWIEDNRFRLWACGVAIGPKAKDLYLFDPRLGIPIPGPKGKIATLAEVMADPKLLAQLDAPPLKYDVMAEELKKVEAFLVCPLSSTAPRMLQLQKVLLRERSWDGDLLPYVPRVRLAEVPKVARDMIRDGAGKTPVRFLPGGAGLMRISLPKESGGTNDTVNFPINALPGFTSAQMGVVPMPRSQLLQLAAVPWIYFPADFRDTNRFPLNAGIGLALRQMYQGTVLQSMGDPNSPRELILRGRTGKTTSEQLALERDRWQGARQRRLPDAEMAKGIKEWIEKAEDVHAKLLGEGASETESQAALARVYRWKPDEPMDVLITGSIASVRAADATFLLGLCMHERAARLQGRFALASRSGMPLPDEKRRADEAWKAAQNWWKDVLEQFGDRPMAATAQRLRGEALWELGRKKEAIAVWKDVSQPQPDLQKLGQLWLSKRNAD